MANDFLKKQPSRNEQLIYELYARQEDMGKSIWTTSALVTAMAYLLEVDPEKLARLLTTEHDKVQEYGNKVNKFLSEIEKERTKQAEEKPGEPETEVPVGEDNEIKE